MQEYGDAIRDRVCSVCIDAVYSEEDQFIRCGLSEIEMCPVDIYLPKIIDVVKSVDSPQIEDYVDVLRNKVCGDCEESEGDVCPVRLKANCALDRYFVLVAEAIEEVDNRRAEQSEKESVEVS